MSIIAVHQTSKPHELAREINKLTDGIERDSKLAGQYLATLKAGKPLGITWEHYLKDCGVKISWQYADKLIAATKPKSPEKSTGEPRQKREPPVDTIEESPEASAEAMKAKLAELDDDNGGSKQTAAASRGRQAYQGVGHGQSRSQASIHTRALGRDCASAKAA